MKTNSALVAKLRAAADALQKQIDHLGRPMTQNPTPKRNKEYQSRLHDCRNLERLQRALRALADGHEAGTLPAELKELKAREEIRRLVHKGLDGSRGGCYSVIEADDYDQKTPAARKLQSMIDAGAAHRERRRNIEALQAEIALANIPGYFPTPAPIVKQMMQRARLRDGLAILEPSAGSGNIADAIAADYSPAAVECMEHNPRLRNLLTLKGYSLAGSDFMEAQPAAKYDRVLMNPPFEKQQDLAHVRRAYEFLKPGGILVAIMAPGFEFRSDRKTIEFRDWLTETGATWEKLPDGAFKSSGTGVSTRLVVIEKTKTLPSPAPVAPRPIPAPISPAPIPAPMPAPLAAGQVQTLFGPEFVKQVRRKPAPLLTSQPAQLSLFA